MFLGQRWIFHTTSINNSHLHSPWALGGLCEEALGPTLEVRPREASQPITSDNPYSTGSCPEPQMQPVMYFLNMSKIFKNIKLSKNTKPFQSRKIRFHMTKTLSDYNFWNVTSNSEALGMEAAPEPLTIKSRVVLAVCQLNVPNSGHAIKSEVSAKEGLTQCRIP